jgi:hypothetical protein
LGDKSEDVGRGLAALSGFMERISKDFATLDDGVNECTDWLCKSAEANSRIDRIRKRAIAVLGINLSTVQ